MASLTNIVWFFLLSILTANSPARSADSYTNYDITTLFNNSIAKTLLNANNDEIVHLLMANMKNLSSTRYETEIVRGTVPFQDKFYFSTDYNITTLGLEPISIQHKFTPDQVTIIIPKLRIKIEGYVGASKDMTDVEFESLMDFMNISIKAIKSPDNVQESQIRINLSHDNFQPHYIFFYWSHKDTSLEKKVELRQKIERILPTLFLQTIQHDKNFLQSLDTIFCDDPEKEITSVYPDFPAHAEQYYYFIPNITSFDRTLSNITIKGLSNFQSQKFETFNRSGQSFTVLTIKNIRGNANLYYGTQNQTTFPLDFEADNIFILVVPIGRLAIIVADDYLVTQTQLNTSLTTHQSKWVMEGILLALGSSIMPSMKIVLHRHESMSERVEHPIVRIYKAISRQFQGNTIQKLYQDWNISIPQNTTLQSDLHNYTITLDNIPAPILSPEFPYPDRVYCEFYDQLTIHYGLLPNFVGNIRLNNSTHVFDHIKFALHPSFVRLIKRYNDDYEPSINTTLFVQLYPNEHNFTEYEQNEIIKKTQQMLTSLIKETVMLYAKPFLSLPLDHCTRPVKIFDDFLPFFADHELPYYISDAAIANNTTTQISNVVITEWTKRLGASIKFSNYFEIYDRIFTHRTHVCLRLGVDGKVMMNYNDTSGRFKKLVILLDDFRLSKDLMTGNAFTWFNYNSVRILPNNTLVPKNDSNWIVYELVDTVSASFTNII